MTYRAYISILIAICAFFLFGMPGALAGCTYTYTGDANHWYAALVHHYCGSSSDYAEYNLHGSLFSDADLYVKDEYSGNIYRSRSSSSEETLIVPVHCGYNHVVMVNIYRGSGNWRVCSPQIQWNEGFRDYTHII